MMSEILWVIIVCSLIYFFFFKQKTAYEIMIGTSAIKNLIRENKIAQMFSAIQTGQAIGMQTLDQNLQDLLARGLISKDEARKKAANKDIF